MNGISNKSVVATLRDIQREKSSSHQVGIQALLVGGLRRVHELHQKPGKMHKNME